MYAALKAKKTKTKKVKAVTKIRPSVEPIRVVDNNFDLDLLKETPKPGDYILRIPKGYKRIRIGAVYNKWLQALISGKFKQGESHLAARSTRRVKGVTKTDTRYCCLGILSKLQGRLHQLTSAPAPGPYNSKITYLSDCASSQSTEGTSDTVLAIDNPLRAKIGATGEFLGVTQLRVCVEYCDPDLHKKFNNTYSKSLLFNRLTSLAEANDAGMTFKQIAHIISRLCRV